VSQPLVLYNQSIFYWGCRGRDRMVVGFTTTDEKLGINTNNQPVKPQILKLIFAVLCLACSVKE